MDIYVVTTFHFSQTPASISYHASEREACIAAAERVNAFRADLDPVSLSLVDGDCWQLGLAAAQLVQLAVFGLNVTDVDVSKLADASGFDVRLEKSELQGMTTLALDDRERSTVLAALRGYQRHHCPSDLADTGSNLGRHKSLSPDAIDDLCTRINCDTPFPVEANIVVTLDGGLVQGIAADRPITVRVVDYDVEGADSGDLVMIPRDQGEPVPASVSGWAVDSVCIDPEWIANVDAACASESRATALMAGA
ncbi:hypothetical protein GR702_08315 [Novosphingobium sp. FGD1]|uniref:Uncharacterized protein n=3 Tax=Sphingomonadaceae TaxID=41297 RepID=A0A1E1EY16_9SPHN|nr:hypothetical protein [Novosphingobium silvae]BAV63140.1 hypothetical protein SCLO_1001000 [Sphingobium cloacae]